MTRPVPADGKAMLDRPANYHENWKKARELGKQLAAVLEEIGDSEFAYIRPASNQFAVIFGGSPHEGRDPLLVAIEAYHESTKAFLAIPEDFTSTEEENAAIDRTFGPALAELTNWDKGARSREGVVAALELIQSEQLAHGLGVTLIDAIISYVKGEML